MDNPNRHSTKLSFPAWEIASVVSIVIPHQNVKRDLSFVSILLSGMRVSGIVCSLIQTAQKIVFNCPTTLNKLVEKKAKEYDDANGFDIEWNDSRDVTHQRRFFVRVIEQ